jgi:predicted ester cyclase
MGVEPTTAVRRLYDEVFNAGDLAVADELVSPTFVGHGGPGGDRTGPDFLKKSAAVLRGAISDLHFDLHDVFAGGDRVVARWTSTGRHTGEGLGQPPSGEPIRSDGIVIFRVDDTGLAEQWSAVQFGR